MDQNQKTWAIRAGMGAGVCALLTAWMVPNTTPTAKPSVIAKMAGTAEAQKPTYSAVPDSAIPSWAASLQQMTGMTQPSAAPPPARIADVGPIPQRSVAANAPLIATDEATQTEPAPPMPQADEPPPPVVARADPPPPPPAPRAAPVDSYQAQRAAWQARLDTVMQGQHAPGGDG